MNSRERGLLVVLAAINFTHILDFMIMMPLGNYLMPYFTISPAQFSFLVGAYTLSAGFSGFVAAFFVDQFDRKKVLMLGYIGFLIGTIACGFAPTYKLLLLARFFAGLFGGLIGAQVLAIVSDTFSYERRGAAMGAVMSSFAIASTLGVPIALYLALHFSWHAPFRLVGIVGVLLLPLIQRFVPAFTMHLETKNNPASKLQILGEVLKDKKQKLALLFSGMIMMGHFLVVPFINPYMEFNHHYSKEQTPKIYLVGGLAAFISAHFFGRLSDRIGKLKVFTVCILFALPLVVFLTRMPEVPFAIVLVVFAFWFMFSTGRGVTGQALVSNVVDPRKRGSFMSFNGSVQQLGTAIASFVSGMIVIKGDNGQIYRYEWLGYLSVFILIVCAWLGNSIFRSSDKGAKLTSDLELKESAVLSDQL